MKKRGLILALALSVLIFTGCGKETEDKITSEVTTSEETTEEVTEATTEATTEKETEKTTESTEMPTTEAATESQTSQGVKAISPEDAQAMLMMELGEKDEETGNEFSYGYIENVQVDGVTYLVFDWRWLVDGNHMSKLADIFVTADGSKIYEGIYMGPEDCTVYLDAPLN